MILGIAPKNIYDIASYDFITGCLVFPSIVIGIPALFIELTIILTITLNKYKVIK